jgi:hypothetical protein
MSNNKREILKRVLLLMKYDNSKTLNENTEIILEQTINPNDYKTANDWCNRGEVKNLEWVDDNLNVTDTFKGKKGYCRLSKKTQDSLKSQYGASGAPYFPAVNQDQWFAIYALWLSQQVEGYKMINIWNTMPTGKCEKNKLYVNLQGQEISLEDALTGEKNVQYDGKKMKSLFICYNDDVATYKPYDQIKIKNIISNAGRLDSTSLPRYSGKYIPSFAEVMKGYGYTANYSRIMNALNGGKELWQNVGNKVGKGNNSKIYKAGKPSTGNVHDILSLLQVVTVIIPVVGPFLSLGIGLVDSGIYYAEGDKKMAALTLGLSILFDLPILKAGFGNIGKQAIQNLTEEEIIQISKSILENNTKNLPENLDEILKALENEMKNNPEVRKQYEDFIKDKSVEILGNKKMLEGLSPNTVSAVKKAAKGELAAKTLTTATVGTGVPLTAKGGYEVAKPLIRKNIQTKVESEGYKWESVKKVFGSSGSKEDNEKLSYAWSIENWRPGLEVPEEYQTEMYKQMQKEEREKLKQKLIQNLEDSELETIKPIEPKTIRPLTKFLTNPKTIATRDSLEKTYSEYEDYLK